jgi:hypothetical protein
MNHQFLTGMSRRSRHAFERRHKEIRRRAKKGLYVVLQAIEIVLQANRDAETTVSELYRTVNESVLD